MNIIEAIGIVNADTSREFCEIGGYVAIGMIALCIVAPLLCIAWNKASRFARWTFFVFSALGMLYAGSKGRVNFPYTDPEVLYLTDAGSFVTNTYVHINFTRNILVPTAANLYVDGCDIKWTNDVDKTAHMFNVYSSTFAASIVPFDIQYAHATNYNWYVYTDWVPPPVVHTNGVAFIVWQIGVGKATNDLAMTRTGVYRGENRIAPNAAITNAPPLSGAVGLPLESINDLINSQSEDNQ